MLCIEGYVRCSLLSINVLHTLSSYVSYGERRPSYFCMIFYLTGSDYINASYIRDYRGEQSFIASQAPRACTIDDMWRMIWQENINVIVMLTKLKVCSKIFCLAVQSYGFIYDTVKKN